MRSLRHQRAAAADALKVSKDKEVWFIIGLGVFIIAVIAAALVGIKYARTCLLGDKAAAPKPPKVAPRQGADPSLSWIGAARELDCPQRFYCIWLLGISHVFQSTAPRYRFGMCPASGRINAMHVCDINSRRLRGWIRRNSWLPTWLTGPRAPLLCCSREQTAAAVPTRFWPIFRWADVKG